jgi:hypothetical protein
LLVRDGINKRGNIFHGSKWLKNGFSSKEDDDDYDYDDDIAWFGGVIMINAMLTSFPP